MTRLMQSASALTLAAALAVTPMLAAAQQAAESDAEQAVEAAAQETQEAAGATVEAAGEAAEEAGQALEQAGEAAGQAVEETAQEATGEMEEVEAEVIVLEPKPAETNVRTTTETETMTGTTAGTAEGAVIVEGEAELQEMQPVQQVEGTIRMQDENSVLTSDLVGATVFNPANEKIGEIDDAILSLDGMVEGVVIGVGGFLGLGEKKVAIEMQQLRVQTDEGGQPQLFLDTTKEALESAPEFVTAEDQRNDVRNMQARQPAPVEGGMMTSDPAPLPREQSGEVVVPAQD